MFLAVLLEGDSCFQATAEQVILRGGEFVRGILKSFGELSRLGESLSSAALVVAGDRRDIRGLHMSN